MRGTGAVRGKHHLALTIAGRLGLTIVKGDFEGDAFFPPYEHLIGDAFERLKSEAYSPEKGRPGFRFETFVRATDELDSGR